MTKIPLGISHFLFRTNSNHSSREQTRFRNYLVARGALSLVSLLLYTLMLELNPGALTTLFTLSVAEAFSSHLTPVNGLILRRNSQGYPVMMVPVLVALSMLILRSPSLLPLSLAVALSVISDAWINVNVERAYLYQSAPLIILPVVGLFNPLVAYLAYSLTKTAIAMPRFSLHYSFRDHAHLYGAQLSRYAVSWFQNTAVLFLGVTPLYSLLSKIVAQPASVATVLYQRDADPSILVRLGVLGGLLISAMVLPLDVPVSLMFLGIALSSFSFLVVTETRKKVDEMRDRKVLVATVMGALFSVGLTTAVVVLRADIYMLLLAQGGYMVEYIFLRDRRGS